MEYFVFHFEKFLLVFARIMGLFFTVSFFSSDALPETIRLGLIFLVTTAIYPLVSAFVPEQDCRVRVIHQKKSQIERTPHYRAPQAASGQSHHSLP